MGAFAARDAAMSIAPLHALSFVGVRWRRRTHRECDATVSFLLFFTAIFRVRARPCMVHAGSRAAPA
ncbi:hypothetical protein B0G62_11488 [Paraburkholderia eburnea]|uniref:Uncharacterized protein n=2 Tax=Paraburkholderia eburnea TaxID=1189126 RepID=A0A2S4M1B7_9BURK|nr:hypothetical protein B0G62_11488 [Paraburkholderia eburnea]PRZ22381.1 hypothetical protein BX588_107224 [Paraburkholderia eburnea]